MIFVALPSATFTFSQVIFVLPVPPEKEGLVHVIGLIALLALFVVLTFHDIRTFILK